MARRGMHVELQEQYDELMASPSTPFGPENAEVLTALRRAEGKPDPIYVHVQLIDTDTEGRPKLTDSIRPALENVDSEQNDVYLTHGGDDRSGREARWRVHLTNEAGVRVPDADFCGTGMGGGLFGFGPVKFGEKTQEDWLPLRDYVAPPPSGRYQMEVIYSEQVIADDANLDGLIVWKSDPIAVIVDNPRYPPFQISALPLLGMFGLFTAGSLIVRIRQRRRAVPGAGLAPFLSRRDGIVMCLVLALLVGWSLDVGWLNLQISRAQADSGGRWTIKLAD